MARVKLNEDLRPLSDLETQTSEIQRAVDKAESDIAEGNWVEDFDVLVKLKRWSAGEP